MWPGVSLTFDVEYSSARNRWETHGGRYYFDMRAADMAQNFFPLFLTHHMGEFAGLPFELRPDQANLMTRPIFGWKRAQDGLRRFRKMFAFCPKGYGKSPFGAGTGIYLARYDQEPAAEVYAVAAETKQARIVFENAKIMVEASPDLSAGCDVLRDALVWTESHSGYYVISSDASSKHGFRPHAIIFDEMHAQRNRDLFEALTRSMVKRRQPLMIIITHAGMDDEGIAYEEYDLARRVLVGNVDLDTVLPVIFESQPGEDWQDPAVWRRVNPGHGVTVKHEAIVEECREAVVEPRKRNDFLRYHLNKWTSQATAWIPIEWWDACQSVFGDDLLTTLECGAGLDLAQKWDLAAFVVVFRRYLSSAPAATIQVVGEDEAGELVKRTVDLNYELYVRPYFWIPEDTMRQHEREDGISYSAYRDAGLVTATEGPTIDYNRIYADITTKILPKYPKLKQGTIGYDPSFATDLATNLRDRGGFRTVELQQNYRHLSEPSQIIEALVKGRRVHHDGHRVLHWNFMNVSVKPDDAGRIKPVKPRNPSKRIDGVVALIMGDRAISLNVHEDRTYPLFFLGGPREVNRT